MALIMVALIGVLIIMMIRNGRKRQQTMLELKKGLVPGAEVMLQSGIYGTVVSVDQDDNKLRVESSPGTILTVHLNAVANVVTPIEADETSSDVTHADDDPRFGERTNDSSPDDTK
ncbi:preprotein translocase subunit YajC [Klugiella xanthotipulae]|nr:preprotein translocase subunit YajC [Klugiella xanthotipulae]